jgi:RNA polymerase sigma-70 factor (ECF subfamily)
MTMKMIAIARTCVAPKDSSTSDETLVARLKGGDESAFNELYEKYRGRLYGLCFKILKNHADAEDLAQEVFLRLYQKAANFRGESQFKTWLYRIAINASRTKLRDKRLDGTSLDELMDAPVMDNSFLKYFAIRDRRLELVPELLALDKALGELPPTQLVVFRLYQEGYHHREITEMLGLKTIGNSKSRLMRAKASLRSI